MGVLCASAAQQPAAASPEGNYKEIRDFEPLPRDQQSAVVQMLRSGSVSDPQLFEAFYNYRLSRLTWKENFGSLAKWIRDLKTRDLRQSQGQAHDDLNAYILQWMQRLVSDEELDPRVRYNAALMIGDLDRIEPSFAGAGAVPLPEALPVLLGLIGDDDLITIAALKKILRHAEAGISDVNLRTRIASTMLDSIAAADRHAWVHRRAADVLGVLGMPGTERNSANVVDALAGLVADEKRSRSFRCDAAESLAGIDFAAAPQTVDYSEIAHALAKLVADVGNSEVKKGTPNQSLRRLITQLNAVDEALNGRPIGQGVPRPGNEPSREGGLIKATANTPHADYVGSVAEKLQTMLEPLSSLAAGGESDEVPEEFQAPLKEFDEWVEQNSPTGEVVSNPGDG